jgi:outer membrane protein assembly factor BamB
MSSKRLSMALLAGLALAGCASEPAKSKPAAAAKGKIEPAAKDAPEPEIKLADLESRGLDKRWYFNLAEPIQATLILEDTLYVYTGFKNLYAINLDDGLVRWQYGVPNGLDFPPAVYSYKKDGLPHTDELFLVSKDTLHVLDRDHGFLLWKKELDFSVSSPPSASASHIYLGSWEGRINAIGKSSHMIDWSYVTNGPVTTRAESGERGNIDSIFVGSEDGRVYAFAPNREERKWSYQTRGGIQTPPYFFHTFLYVGSKDFTIYCLPAINTDKGSLEWRYPTGAPVVKPPIAFMRSTATKDNPAYTLYVISGDTRLLAMNVPQDPKKAPVRWQYEKCEKVVACARRDVYVLNTDGNLVALSDETGKERWASPLKTGADLYVTNPFDPKSEIEKEKRLASTVVLAWQSGWLVAVKEKSEY